ncbi:MFS general substrate transporter [Coniophora puteana RWD-64-598 SS2]|uniref:MFS general substrate transporter n=1 Tax=Coniophora puteana (strain RWD-64-598) TaxID=741705 RepID=A0A5M3MJM0_CONPW|nr:MFS general substrate transporter [Coniophora puteana RWD-64-598 SS2]EIW79412.1 MFS general substrate transporter [Coniophora puteana RWD-64-598 SS2]
MSAHHDETNGRASDPGSPASSYDPSPETPLLSGQTTPRRRTRTPLPKLQIGILMLVQLAEPITGLVIYPFINQLIAEVGITGGDDKKIGYYAGLIESLYYMTEASTALHWSRLSDRVGRKPVMLVGLIGSCLSIFAFGLSRTFAALLISRCISGMLNGNAGVMKSMIGDLTDSTNMSQAFALLPIVFCTGGTLSPLIGGTLAHPEQRWPHLFSGKFWYDYPYFLPCAVSGILVALFTLIMAIWLKEVRKPIAAEPSSSSDVEQAAPQTETSLPLRALMIPSVIYPVANYGMLSLADMCFLALFALFFASPIDVGGLGFPPSIIGTLLGLLGLVDAVVQTLFFARVVERLGAKTTFRVGVFALFPLFFLFPVLNWVIVWNGGERTPLLWVLITLQLSLVLLMDMSYACIFMLITAAAPNKRTLGAVNGLGQTVASTARAISPAMVTSIFAASKQYNLLGGNLVYVFMLGVILAFFILSGHLPEPPEEKQD